MTRQEYMRAWYQKNKKRHLEVVAARRRQITKTNNEFYKEYLLTHACVDCGETDPLTLEFDHLTTKFSEVSHMIAGGYSLQAIKREIAKCEVVCANCHSRRTHKRTNSKRLTW